MHNASNWPTSFFNPLHEKKRPLSTTGTVCLYAFGIYSIFELCRARSTLIEACRLRDQAGENGDNEALRRHELAVDLANEDLLWGRLLCLVSMATSLVLFATEKTEPRTYSNEAQQSAVFR